MICDPCRRAADFRSDAQNPNDPFVMESCEEGHLECTGCDCQHRVEPKTIGSNPNFKFTAAGLA